MTAVERLSDAEVVSPELTEALAAQQLVRDGLDNLYEGLARFVAVTGWRLVGFDSFRQWARQELAMSLEMADLHLKKTKHLMSMSNILGKTIAELAPTVSLRSMKKRAPASPTAVLMRRAANKLASVPVLTDPAEVAAAKRLRDALERLLG